MAWHELTTFASLDSDSSESDAQLLCYVGSSQPHLKSSPKVMLACIAQHTHERHVVGGMGLGDLSMDQLPS